jgi:hypothetical protein
MPKMARCRVFKDYPTATGKGGEAILIDDELYPSFSAAKRARKGERGILIVPEDQFLSWAENKTFLEYKEVEKDGVLNLELFPLETILFPEKETSKPGFKGPLIGAFTAQLDLFQDEALRTAVQLAAGKLDALVGALPSEIPVTDVLSPSQWVRRQIAAGNIVPVPEAEAPALETTGENGEGGQDSDAPTDPDTPQDGSEVQASGRRNKHAETATA